MPRQRHNIKDMHMNDIKYVLKETQPLRPLWSLKLASRTRVDVVSAFKTNRETVSSEASISFESERWRVAFLRRASVFFVMHF